ncbi:hypothetical protein ACPXB5_11330 [Micromonospora arida]|uniref:hypothetical protein n=1 Tax=Micromonospora arida TaxID=2203715 RepID=UPI003CFBA779
MAELSPVNATGTLTEAQYETLAHPQAPDGVIGDPEQGVFYKSGNQIGIVGTLTALVRGFPYFANGGFLLSPDLTGAARTDLVVLRLDRANGYTVRAAIRKGTPGAGAPAPVMGTAPSDLWELPIGEYDVASGAVGATRLRAWFIGDDGQILVRNGARPPHAPARRIREVDTGRTYESTGTSWLVVLDDAGDLTLPLAGGWAAGINHLTRINGEGRLAISPQRTGGNVAEGVTVNLGTLPAGTRPRRAFEVPGRTVSGNADITMLVSVNGVISLRFWNAGVTTGAFCLFPPFTWPIA